MHNPALIDVYGVGILYVDFWLPKDMDVCANIVNRRPTLSNLHL